MTAATSGCLTTPGRPTSFRFEGRTVEAIEGQSIGAALHAAGVRVFSRSFKYHRPRGLFCVSGDCPSCLMQVDGRPNVRTCIEPVRPGAVVVAQHAWPSLEFDLLRTFDHLSPLLPVGFYYKSFHKPRWIWPWFEHAVRQVAGLGRIDPHEAPTCAASVEHVHTDVCVIGAGPAGLAAAAEAAEAGTRVLVLERLPRAGGHLLWDTDQPAELKGLLGEVRSQPAIQVRTGTAAFGLYEAGVIGAVQGNRLVKVRARQIIVCTGGRQRPFIFHNNDLPGVMLGDGVLRLARLYGVTAGRRAVVATDNAAGARLASQLMDLGIEVAAVIDRRPAKAPEPSSAPRGRGRWPVVASSAVLAAHGNKQLVAVRIAGVRADGQVDPGSAKDYACDLLCVASAPVPAAELLWQAGMRFRFERGRWLPDRSVPGLHAAGIVAGTFDLERQILEGRLRGAEAAAALGLRPGGLQEHHQEWTARSGPPFALDHDSYGPQVGGDKRFVCLCEDATEKDLAQAVSEGFDHVETLKRYATVSMGPCQGKMCGQAFVEGCARLTMRDVNAVGTTTSRPPAIPVELGVLAADRCHHPVRRTALHHWHETNGARWMDAGQWKRPENYGDPMAEVEAVRTRVGLIDVSTLGKIELIGRDAAELLERVYLNRWADLQPGRARYGALCTDEGILFDDGVGARLGPEHFYVTATTGNAEAVFQWLQLWKATWQLDVTLLNQTSANAAVNLAGPRAREALSRLTTLDLSPASFPYMAHRQADIAGIPCHLFRIGFVGELGYEIHCPVTLAWHLWHELLGTGASAGICPFGVEAQRILRLEKGHLIIGTDTDALSNPLDAGLGWMVRFDKPAFHGREPLQRLRAMGPRTRLVGFHMADASRVPPEGCQVVEQGRPVGRVTSARYSPTLRRTVGLAWAPAELREGQRFFIRWNGADVPAVVAPMPFYDPQGTRLRM